MPAPKTFLSKDQRVSTELIASLGVLKMALKDAGVQRMLYFEPNRYRAKTLPPDCCLYAHRSINAHDIGFEPYIRTYTSG